MRLRLAPLALSRIGFHSHEGSQFTDEACDSGSGSVVGEMEGFIEVAFGELDLGWGDPGSQFAGAVAQRAEGGRVIDRDKADRATLEVGAAVPAKKLGEVNRILEDSADRPVVRRTHPNEGIGLAKGLHEASDSLIPRRVVLDLEMRYVHG